MVDGKYEGITMGEFIEKVNYLGTYLVNNGYKGKNIGIYSPNSIAWMISDVAIMNYVGLSIGLNKDWKDDNLDYAIGKCEISLMLYSKSLEDKINVVKDKYPDVEFVSIEENFDRICFDRFSVSVRLMYADMSVESARIPSSRSRCTAFSTRSVPMPRMSPMSKLLKAAYASSPTSSRRT